ncbi:MAG: YceI family protein [Sphingomonadaceae bacterium]
MAELLENESRATSSWVMDHAHSSVEFAVKHMVITTVRGRFAQFQADLDFDPAAPELSSVEARIDAASIDTRSADRDAHLRSPDFLDVERYPHILFRSKRVEPLGAGRYRIVGDLTIRDVTREVALDATFAGVGKNPWGKQVAGFSAETAINRKEFGLNWNVALETGGWLVGDEVRIFLEMEATQEG